MSARVAVASAALLAAVSVIAVPADAQRRSSRWFGGDLEVLETRRESCDASRASVLRVQAGAGSLRVSGDETAAEVTILAVLRGRSKADLKRFTLQHSQEGEALVVTADADGVGAIDLELTVPARLRLAVSDESGDVVIERMGADVDVQDGAGSIEIRGVGGAVRVGDGSGSLSIEDVRGDVRIDDGSGAVDVRSVGGDVLVRDGSGPVRVRAAGGGVRVWDGSGSVDVADVEGDFSLEQDGSGGVSHANVRGRVDLGRRE